MKRLLSFMCHLRGTQTAYQWLRSEKNYWKLKKGVYKIAKKYGGKSSGSVAK